MPSKPRLFIDVDGVILARYGPSGRFQMRPHAGDLLALAVRHFRCFWLTCHDRENTAAIERFACVRGMLGFANFPIGRGLDKVQGVADNGGLRGEWYVIEDERPLAQGWDHLVAKGLSWRWLICPQNGRDALLHAQRMLASYLQTRVMAPPRGWKGGTPA